MTLFDQHQELLQKAIAALHARTFFAAFPEHPAPAVYGETADADGKAAFEHQLQNKFTKLLQSDPTGWIGQEESPYTQAPLGITYPQFSVDQLTQKSQAAASKWQAASAQERAGLLIESLLRVKKHFFEIAYATMHTTGQGYMMAFQASGPHAADRAMETIALGFEELQRFPTSTRWEKPMGKTSVVLNKEWHAVPKGISLVIGCSTFPTWNSVPGIYGSLITGNTVIVKPHGGAVLPIAIFVATLQHLLAEQGFDPHVCQLAVDTIENPITTTLATHRAVKLIDYTGNAVYGNSLEALPNKIVFTEKTGVNSVILDSVVDADKVVANLAFSICLYSGQMCTAPQNIFIPAAGIPTASGTVSPEAFAQKIVDQVNALVDNPKAGPFVLGAIQNRKTSERIAQAEKLPGKVLLTSRSIENPLFKNARIHTPTVIAVDAKQHEVYNKELFGPILLIITTENTNESLTLAKTLAESHGAITCSAYTTNPEVRTKIATTMAMVGAPVSFNLTGGIYVNQHAAFSDFHVTGGNPAGNATFTDSLYIVRRFTWVGHREAVS